MMMIIMMLLLRRQWPFDNTECERVCEEKNELKREKVCVYFVKGRKKIEIVK